MIARELCEQAVSMVKTVWRKRGPTITRRETSRLLATDVAPEPPRQAKDHTDAE